MKSVGHRASDTTNKRGKRVTNDKQTAAEEWEAYQRALKNAQFRDVSWLLLRDEDEESGQ